MSAAPTVIRVRAVAFLLLVHAATACAEPRVGTPRAAARQTAAPAERAPDLACTGPRVKRLEFFLTSRSPLKCGEAVCGSYIVEYATGVVHSGTFDGGLYGFYGTNLAIAPRDNFSSGLISPYPDRMQRVSWTDGDFGENVTCSGPLAK